jgi:hypothetical protein
MKISGQRCSAVLLLLCLSFPLGAAPAAKPAEPKPSPEDPLGRSTPYGTVMGFLQAANKGDYELASNYLEGKQSARRKAELARSLRVVLNRGLKIGPDDLSKAPAGSLDDGLAANLEKVGTATFESESLDVVLRLSKAPDAPPLWLFSADTLLGVTAAAVGRSDLAGIGEGGPLPVLPAFHVAQRAGGHSVPGGDCLAPHAGPAQASPPPGPAP